MKGRAKGPFEVKLAPQSVEDTGDGARLGRLSLDKTYFGDLQAAATGEMLTVQTPVDGSAGYVAVEKVTGALGGRRGSFALLHRGTMAGGDQSLSVTVVPDSGTGDLTGLTGTLAIDIDEGTHSYSFEYALPE